jgi:two-component system response regulator AtoC
MVKLAARIWLVGVDAEMASVLLTALSTEKFTIEHFKDLVVDLDSSSRPDAIILSVLEPGMAALNVLVSARKAPAIPVIVLVPPDEARIAVEALKLGAVDALVMPLNRAELLTSLQSILQNVERLAPPKPKLDLPQPTGDEVAVFLSRSPKMQDIWHVATTVARTDVPVLVLGESGVGKDVVARFIHRHSRRSQKILVKVNCAALPHDLLESELFGYERGAFTGAINEKPGQFELADKGCIVLDEIGEMPTNLQAKLLHVLEGGEFTRLGGKRPVKVDVRVLALTNRRLHEAIPRGEFREDLYFRLSVVKISIPPLRERKEDIAMLSSYFVKRHREALESTIQELPPELLDVFSRYHWPGNVRQLENTIRRYLIMPELDMELNAPPPAASEPEPPKRVMAVAASATGSVLPFSSPGRPGPNDTVSLKEVSSMAAERAEREMVMHILEQTNWNRSQAARRLNICYRALLNKLKKWQLHEPKAS